MWHQTIQSEDQEHQLHKKLTTIKNISDKSSQSSYLINSIELLVNQNLETSTKSIKL